VKLTPIPYEEWDFEALAAISPGMKPPPLNVVHFFAHHPELARQFLSWNHYVNSSRTSTLPKLTREVVVLRVAARRANAYEWKQHSSIARRAGLTETEIAAIAAIADGTTTLSGPHRLIVTAVDELYDDGALTDQTADALAGQFTEQQLIELVFLVGTYSMFSMVLNVFGVEPDPDLDETNFDGRIREAKQAKQPTQAEKGN
jgi:AhpD family alkylhydroperoxidase